MKHLLKFTFVVAAVLMLASCYKCPPEGDHVVAYTVDKGPEQRVYLVDNNEWQALLDRFCDYAEDGSEVTFYNANHKAAKSPTKEAVTYSTTDREAMKRWMAQMEDEGKTVTVTYDPATGTWNGTAYATAPQPQSVNYTGVIIAVPKPQMNAEQNMHGVVMALKTDTDTLILATDGQWHRNNLEITHIEVYDVGDTVTLCGTIMTMHDYHGNTFRQMELAEDPVFIGNGVATYISEGYEFMGNGYNIILTIDSSSRTAYVNYVYKNMDVNRNLSYEDFGIMIPEGVWHYIHLKGDRLILQVLNQREDTFYVSSLDNGSLFMEYTRDMNGIMPTSCILVPAPQGIQTWYSEQMGGIIMNILPDAIDSQPPIYQVQICAQWNNIDRIHFNPFDHNFGHPTYHADGGNCEIHRHPTNRPGLDWEVSLQYSQPDKLDYYVVDSLGLSGHNLDNNDFTSIILHDMHRDPLYSEYVFNRIK